MPSQPTVFARFGAWLRGSGFATLPGPLPFATGSMLSQEWSAPYLVRLPSIPADTRRARDV